MYIQSLKINGYKKFKDFTIDFSPHINVLIGENEAGKSTILEAIDIVLNQKTFISPNASFEQYFNQEIVQEYKFQPSIKNLPKIEIELFFNDEKDIRSEYFNGLHSSFSPTMKTGIKFTYKFDESHHELLDVLYEGNYDETFIPLDYYIAEWNTFAGRKYINKNSPLKNVLIDNSIRKNNLFDSYSRRIYINKLAPPDRQNLSHQFRKNVQHFVNSNTEKLNLQDYSFGIDEGKTVLENLLDLKSEGVSIQNKGKGKENLIKTEIALEVKSDLILLEEPENHLSYLNTRKLIKDIQNKCDGAQIIITTHDPLIVSRLDLRNTIWICNRRYYSLKNIPLETAEYFMKTDNMQLLNYILAQRVILVEGNSEYILLPQLTINTFNYTLEKHVVELLSGGGITYKHYIELSKIVKNRLLVITDNDGDQETINSISETNKENSNVLIKCSPDINEFTFEVCLFNSNQSKLQTISEKKPGTTAEYRKKALNQNLAYMLKNKTEAALRISEEDDYKTHVLLPQYIQEGIEWLIQK
ncbi:DNA replication and repair protein RecF [Paenibacillus auburnensis]|uniref:DNA replication and repair protein RecF n=1 Tax=Paenibacillus auburnensis TaxID=2905649 RepID=A0ABM9CAI8_9BACL|nr:AAA family ATPase [Paenibacillus auburnensis]CAH1208566.1 DNA replication and repair protein RecF [Paenibacillus auburnensis]